MGVRGRIFLKAFINYELAGGFVHDSFVFYFLILEYDLLTSNE